MAPARHVIADVIKALEDFAPLGLAEDWDSVGLQVGNPDHKCRRVTLALDLSLASLEASLAQEADLIITHHPLLFRPVSAIRYDQPQGHLIQRLCEEKVSHYAAHTNLDSTVGGLNDHLADQIGLSDRRPLLAPPATTPANFLDKQVGLGRIGRLSKAGTLNQLAQAVRDALQPPAMRIIGHEHGEVSTVAVCTGSGGSLVSDAIQAGADCLITGDVKYHQALDAEAAGMAVLDVGHYASEISCIAILKSLLEKHFGEGLAVIPLEDIPDPIREYR